jgi:glutaredoxin 3
MPEIIVYSTQMCPKCDLLKKVLKSSNVSFKESDMATPESLTELRINGVFTVTAPVLQIDDTFLTYEELFIGENVNLDVISSIV